jgi:hypothetical protein
MTEHIQMDGGLTCDDFILQRDINGKITGGGYNIESMLLKKGRSPMTTLNHDVVQGGGKNDKNVSSLFTDLAVPAGLFYVNQKVPDILYSFSTYRGFSIGYGLTRQHLTKMLVWCVLISKGI